MYQGEQPYECLDKTCEKRFTRKDMMIKHYKRLHENKFVCTVSGCDKRFDSSYLLSRHARFHQNQCPTCLLWCTSLPERRKHELNVHDKSDFPCTEGNYVWVDLVWLG